MTHTETLNILDEIESLVSDQLQVVSYKWLSRNFSLSSNTAKRLLKDFVEKHEKGLEVVYIVSGLLKNGPSDYHARLASSTELPEVEKEFNGKYSVHIYSVQGSIPMDPAAIWNTEFVQAEELFRQHSAIDNCLKGNRFCGVSNSCVKRNIEGTTENITAPRTESVRTTGQSNSSLNFQKSTLPSNQGKNFQHSIPNVVHQAKSETTAAPAKNQSVKSSLDKEKAFPVPANKKNGQGEKNVTGTGGLLKNMWGRVPMKTEDDTPTAEVKNHITDHSEAQKPSHDAYNKGGSDDETRDVNFKRAPKNDNKKRKVIIDFSDDEFEDVISLASPSSPKVNSRPDVELSSEDSGPEKPDADREIKYEEPEVSKEDRQKTASVDASTTLSMEKIQVIGSEAKVNPSKGRTTEVPSSPKRKKVLKSRIDDRGREVTEVVWEETETNGKKKEDTDTSKKLNDGKSANAVNRYVFRDD
ncbi:DNA polymerase subunit Cdc27 [Arabidopsis thaliana x Arabidopsis arenosa]|uniref:DNA polymerase subunit Cdc27 n=2 Tax=Arabidopsis TaxID=3701 RepID=A0A8T2BY28_ARASU|nr:DNA polymerase subunit Cdc27 [Arabidopsis thaliana x Arabidopsis arenosa]KAG7590612.1 DNA polymerase subunit Cdc27 [Arabidopsis suecica]